MVRNVFDVGYLFEEGLWVVMFRYGSDRRDGERFEFVGKDG